MYSRHGVSVMFKLPPTFAFPGYTNLVDVYGLRDSSVAHSVADCQRRCPNHVIPIQKVFIPVYHTLRNTGTLPGLYVPSEREVNQDADEKSKLYSLVSLTPQDTAEGNFPLLAVSMGGVQFWMIR